MSQPIDPAVITGYHAHVYYDVAATRGQAEAVRAGIAAGGFEARLGSWHDEAVGPHTVAMYQVAFPVAEFARLVPWLALNRRGLSVLVHPETGDDYTDHSRFALWLGPPLPLDLSRLKRGRFAAPSP
ncbi:MAG TPA: DOPA 4,5-dioxygenase family protein [Candidatus Sulfotelmatobacter sp.]|nr:DOPA 4,5-dioxygenase family protein [Candidatus Sulfotelmatobacter sp.]